MKIYYLLYIHGIYINIQICGAVRRDQTQNFLQLVKLFIFITEFFSECKEQNKAHFNIFFSCFTKRDKHNLKSK